MKFKVGDNVEIRKDSPWHGSDYDDNPTNCCGEIIEIVTSRPLPIRVKWSNGYFNSYTFEDLKPWGVPDKKDKSLLDTKGSWDWYREIDLNDFKLDEDEEGLELELPACTCDIKILMAKGCQCGGV